MSHSRRTFLKQASAAAALGLVAQLPGSRLWAAAPPAELLPEPDEERLRALALTAVEAARAAGATFADVRLTGGRLLNIGAGFDRLRGSRPGVGWPTVMLRTEYGIRAVVDGAWGLAGGTVLTPDAVRQVAQIAVARARANKPRRPRTLALAPVQRVEDGRWATPIERDPFSVPISEQLELALEALAATEELPGVVTGGVQLFWTENLRIFASSEGTLTTQRVTLASPSASVTARADGQSSPAMAQAEGLLVGGYGYEAVSRVDLAAALRKAAARAVEASRSVVVSSSTDVGRYDLVLGVAAVARLLTVSLAPALNLERVLGYEANRSGTSFAGPPEEILGQHQVGSPLLTLSADRTRPHSPATVGWDDEGVPTGEHTLIRDGVIVDYLTTRQTAAELGGIYQARGAAVGSRGCASGGGQTLPNVRLPNLTLAPGKGNTAVDELIADTKRGFYVEACSGGTDQQLLNTQMVAGEPTVREIRNGKLGGFIRDFAFQFTTPSFWKGVDAIGGAASALDVQVGTGYSPLDPLQLPAARVRAVPVRARDVNVLNTGRTA